MHTSSKSFSRRLAVLTAIALILAAFSGCKTTNRVNQRFDTTFGKKARVTNVHQAIDLPEHLRRVAVLPMYLGRYDHIDFSLVEENFAQELIKKNLFEVHVVTPEDMNERFSRERYSSADYLPTKLLSKLHEAYAIDGVLLVDVSYFSAYRPVGLGVRAKLLDGHTGEIVWAMDQLFDSSVPAVSNAAREFYKTQSLLQYPMNDTTFVLHSPNRFSKYVAESVFSTISNKILKNP
ncbi:MAG: hypothetical protein AAGB46_10560 [Verrucomicrobiota bacterium]